MYSVRALPLAVPLAGSLWIDGTPGAVLLSATGVAVLLLVGRRVHQQLRGALDRTPPGRHAAR